MQQQQQYSESIKCTSSATNQSVIIHGKLQSPNWKTETSLLSQQIDDPFPEVKPLDSTTLSSEVLIYKLC